jgi:tyrosyl-tRNA synthetase
MDAKMRLAEEVVSGFQGAEEARKAADNFQRVFRDRQAPREAPVHRVSIGPAKRLTAFLVELNLSSSKAEAERLIKQHGVEIDGGSVEDVRKEIDFSKPAQFLLRAGKKKFLQIIIE